MCLAVPALIIAIDGPNAEVDLSGVRRRVGLQLVPEARVGDYVLVHTGFAINVLDPDEAAETLRLFQEIDELSRAGQAALQTNEAIHHRGTEKTQSSRGTSTPQQ